MDLVDVESLRDRVWRRIDKSTPDECWPWTGGVSLTKKSKEVYGKMTVRVGPRRKGKSVSLKAHQLVYILETGPIPEGKMICHTCNNPICCNPHHLYAGTHQQNMNDMVRTKRSTAGARNVKAKLTQAKVDEIRQLRKQGLTLKTIAEKFDVHLATIGLICQNKIWRRGEDSNLRHPVPETSALIH